MAGQVLFNNGINIASGGSALLNALLTDIVSETDLQEEYAYIRDVMNFTDTKALSLNQTFSAMQGALELDSITENGLKPDQIKYKLPDKGFVIKEYGGQYQTSFLMKKRIESSNTIEGADPAVKQEWLNIATGAKDLLKGAMMNVAFDMIRLWTLGLDPISASNGPGSPTPKGNTLFSQNHLVRQGTLSFANVAPTNVPLTDTNLQNAIDILKNGALLENGYRVRAPKVAYKLYVGTPLATVARQILNTPGSQAGVYAGTGPNANRLNQFSFKGNMIELVELPFLGSTDKNGVPIGTETTWFLVNPDYLREAEAFRFISLYEPELKNYTNNATDAYVVDLRVGYAVDHYGAEAGIFGSKGDGTPSNP